MSTISQSTPPRLPDVPPAPPAAPPKESAPPAQEAQASKGASSYHQDSFQAAASQGASPVELSPQSATNETLAQGSKGPAVTELQGKLKERGFDPGPADGDFGPNTDNAVRGFQSSQGLEVDGIVGPQTWGKLNEPAAPAPAVYNIDPEGLLPLNAGAPAPAPAANPDPEGLLPLHTAPPASAPAVNPDPEGLLPLNAGAPAAASRPTLSTGASGPEVVDLQNKLNERGYNAGLADGEFGPKTEAAVKSFQGGNGLDQDGIAGPKTWAALESTRPVSQGGGSSTSVSASVDVPGGSISVSPNSISVAPKVELEGPKGTSLSFSSEASLTQDVTHSGGYTTVTAEGSASVSAGGSIDVGRVGVGGSVGRGHSSSYEVRLSDADYVRTTRGEAPTPDPFKPSTLPAGSSVRMDSKDFRNTEFEASYQALALKTGTTTSEGVSIQVDKLDSQKVRVTAGPTEGIEQSTKLGLQVGPVGAFLGGKQSLDQFQLRTAEFDLGTASGQEGYNRFLANGDIPERSGPGVSNPAKIEKLDYNASSSAELSVGIKSLSLKLTAKGNSSSGGHLVTTHEDGSKDVQTTVRYNDRTAVVDARQDARGQTTVQDLTLQLNQLHPEYAKSLEQVYTGNTPSLKGNQDVALHFSPTEAMALRDMAYNSVKELNARGGLTGEAFEKQLADPYGALLGDFNVRELARAKTFEEVAAAMTAGLTSAEGFSEVLLGLAIPNGLRLPGRFG
jgi:peptidoglycan hydrolase-like protein with peptidoglycan-binding domain